MLENIFQVLVVKKIGNRRKMTAEVSEEWATVRGLDPATEQIVKVTAKNGEHVGPTAELSFITSEDVYRYQTNKFEFSISLQFYKYSKIHFKIIFKLYCTVIEGDCDVSLGSSSQQPPGIQAIYKLRQITSLQLTPAPMLRFSNLLSYFSRPAYPWGSRGQLLELEPPSISILCDEGYMLWWDTKASPTKIISVISPSS